MDDQVRLTRQVYELLVEAKRERNRLRAELTQMQRERDEWAWRCQTLVEALETPEIQRVLATLTEGRGRG